MTLRLILMRHAKSSWDQPGLRDHDRVLNQRGHLAAPLMGAYLRDMSLMPDLAYLSSAARVQETWALMALGSAAETVPNIYSAVAADLLRIIQRAPKTARTLMVLGHQPTMQELANQLLPEWVIDDYPTAKLSVIDFEATDWGAVQFGSGSLITEASPKTLV
ncbi:MAG: histidine phosphatase family protein [Pseudomonadota bacterium]